MIIHQSRHPFLVDRVQPSQAAACSIILRCDYLVNAGMFSGLWSQNSSFFKQHMVIYSGNDFKYSNQSFKFCQMMRSFPWSKFLPLFDFELWNKICKTDLKPFLFFVLPFISVPKTLHLTAYKSRKRFFSILLADDFNSISNKNYVLSFIISTFQYSSFCFFTLYNLWGWI